MKNLIKENEDPMTKLDAVELKAWDLTISEKNLRESLEDDLYSKKKMYEDFSAFKDELMDTSDVYFEWEKKHKAFVHPELDLSQMCLFKVVNDG